MANELLSELVQKELDERGLKPQPASLLIGQPPNFLGRIVNQTTVPSTLAKYRALADFLHITVDEVSEALARDVVDKMERDEIAAQAKRRPR